MNPGAERVDDKTCDLGFYSHWAAFVSTPFAGGATDNGNHPVGVSTVSLTLFDITISSYFNGTTYAHRSLRFLPKAQPLAGPTTTRI